MRACMTPEKSVAICAALLKMAARLQTSPGKYHEPMM